MGFQRWLNSNVMAAQVIVNLSGLMDIPQLMAFGCINACAAIASEQRT
jgi:hypothetical protein